MEISDWLFGLMLFFELLFFYHFYSQRSGVHAIYFTWYAWIIDCLGIVSGSVIMSASILAKHTPAAFNFEIPFTFLLLVFVMGSWQTSIHGVKLFLRVFRKEHIRLMCERTRLTK